MTWQTWWAKEWAEKAGSMGVLRALIQQFPTLAHIIDKSAQKSDLHKEHQGPMYSIDMHELKQTFPLYSGTIHPAGTHFSIWNTLWKRTPNLARKFFHAGYFSQHLFACLRKPC